LPGGRFGEDGRDWLFDRLLGFDDEDAPLGCEDEELPEKAEGSAREVAFAAAATALANGPFSFCDA